MSVRRLRPRNRKAAVLLLSAFLMVFLLGVVAFAVDIGYIVTVRTQLQSAVDAAAGATGTRLSLGRNHVDRVVHRLSH